MDITTTINPGKSLGGISIGEQIDDVIARLANTYLIDKTINRTTINGGLITAYHGDDGLISSLSCNSNFKGSFQKKIWPGMTVADVIKNTSSQVAWSGFVQVDRIGGVGLSLPNELDDFERLTDDFDDSYVFEELWVYE
jgi:hypothetical protein